MVALGVDINTREIALAALHDDGSNHTAVLPVAKASRGARRLRDARAGLVDTIRSTPELIADVAIVEVAWPGFALMSLSAVALEAVQDALPAAVVFEASAATWKRESVGHGNATKEQVMAHAQGIGYTGRSQDCADALCMAQAAAERWHRWEREQAA